jgi:molybdenum cofactor biosynthesis enzyme MoaA
LEAAKREHLDRVKLNTVMVRGMNDDEIVEIVEFADEHG